MIIPKLKRIKVSTEQDLRNWLAKNAAHSQDVMIVTCDKSSPKKYVSRAQVHDALNAHGWTSGQSYTLVGNLVGHVARHTHAEPQHP